MHNITIHVNKNIYNLKSIIEVFKTYETCFIVIIVLIQIKKSQAILV